MKVVLSDRAIESLVDAPRNVQRAFDKQLRFLVVNLLHPSLHAKKYDESKDLWQARVNKDWRADCKFQSSAVRSAVGRHDRTGDEITLDAGCDLT